MDHRRLEPQNTAHQVEERLFALFDRSFKTISDQLIVMVEKSQYQKSVGSSLKESFELLKEVFFISIELIRAAQVQATKSFGEYCETYEPVVVATSREVKVVCTGTRPQELSKIQSMSHFVIAYLHEYDAGSAKVMPSPLPSPDRRGRKDKAVLLQSSRNQRSWNFDCDELVE